MNVALFKVQAIKLVVLCFLIFYPNIIIIGLWLCVFNTPHGLIIRGLGVVLGVISLADAEVLLNL